ncbi:unnamed protein product [Trichobilharzia regenti]|nr:unnamed protein product [Trichobilharzia regenti]
MQRTTVEKNECSLVKVKKKYDLVNAYFFKNFPTVRSMLYAFGDDENPLPETVSLVEDIAVHFIKTKKALKVGRPGKISVEDVTYLVRRDSKKFSRVKDKDKGRRKTFEKT